MGEHLEALQEWHETEQRRVQVELILVNVGKATATNVDVSITFPPEVIICAGDDLPASPEPPEPPPLIPLGFGQISGRALLDHVDVFHGLMPRHTPSTVVDPEAGTVTFHTGDLKHGYEKSLIHFWVRLPTRESICSFSAKYEVSVSEPIDVAARHPHFVVQQVQGG